MGSKWLFLLGLLLACARLIASEVAAARELAEAASTSKENSKETNGVKEAQYGGGYPTDPPTYGSPKTNPGCGGYGCCGAWNNGACRCCSYRGEPMDTGPEAKPQN